MKFWNYLLILVLLIQLTACGSENSMENSIPSHEKDCLNIDVRLASDIKNAYFDSLTNDSLLESPQSLYIEQYFGEFNGCHVVKIGGHTIPITPAERIVEVADYKLIFPDSGKIYLYHDRILYTVEEAYHKGLIESNDIYNIAVAIGIDFETVK